MIVCLNNKEIILSFNLIQWLTIVKINLNAEENYNYNILEKNLIKRNVIKLVITVKIIFLLLKKMFLWK